MHTLLHLLRTKETIQNNKKKKHVKFMQLSLTPAEFNPKKLKFSSSIERVGFQKFKELERESVVSEKQT